MKRGFRRIIAPAVVCLTLFVLTPLAAASQHDREAGRDCARSSTGAIPIPDLGTGTYQGFQGGLYPGGSNAIPSDHERSGLALGSQIKPLDPAGNPDPDGAIVVVSLGVSNTWREFEDFIAIVEDQTAPGVVLVNASQAGKPMASWADPQSPTWDDVESALGEAGVSANQVQAAWVKIPERILTWDDLEPFPIDAQTYQEDLVRVLRIAKDRYPNLHIAYLSSRIYGGYNTEAYPSPEPLTYENGFGVKWAIEQQIDGDAELNHDPDHGAVEAPWIAWGPYLWADGTTPRSDGLTWQCSDLRRDGTHPTPAGVRKAAVLIADHFLSAPTAVSWFTDTGEPVSLGELPPVTGRRGGTGEPRGGSPATTTTSGQLEEPIVTTTLVREPPAGEAQGQQTREAANPQSSDPASSILMLITALLLIAVAVGGLALVASRRRGKK